MIEYLAYLTDPALFLTYTHREFLRHPEAFLPAKDDKENRWTELRFKQPQHGIAALFVDQDSVWIRGIEFVDGDKISGLTFDRPRSVDEIPADLFDRLKGIEFKESTISLRRHMTYL
jgi:hypothetical protein